MPSFNANLLLVRYVCGRKHDAAAVLRLAQTEAALRHDAQTLDAYARALYRNGKFTEAKLLSDQALKPGIRSQMLICDPAAINEKAVDPQRAARLRQQCSVQPTLTPPPLIADPAT